MPKKQTRNTFSYAIVRQCHKPGYSPTMWWKFIKKLAIEVIKFKRCFCRDFFKAFLLKNYAEWSSSSVLLPLATVEPFTILLINFYCLFLFFGDVHKQKHLLFSWRNPPDIRTSENNKMYQNDEMYSFSLRSHGKFTN